MIYELKDTDKVEPLFAGWEETCIYSCIQKVMGKIFVTDIDEPKAACAFVGCFAFHAGKPDEELVQYKPDDYVIMVPQNEEWARMIRKWYPDAKRVTRYALKKDTKFDTGRLQSFMDRLPEGYELKELDGDLYDKCLANPAIVDFVSSFESKEKYLEYGRGMVILKSGEIVSGASSYTRYKDGIEIQVDTIPSERRKQLATAVCSALILKCLGENLYPSWDAHNMDSVHLAEKLGYEFSHEYEAYEVTSKV